MVLFLYVRPDATETGKMVRGMIFKAYKGKPRQAEDMASREMVVRLRYRVGLVLTGLRPAKWIGLGGGGPVGCRNEFLRVRASRLIPRRIGMDGRRMNKLESR